MKKLCLFLLLFNLFLFSKEIKAQDSLKYAVKWNLPSLALKNISLEGEVGLTHKISFTLGANFSLPKSLPQLFQNYAADNSTDYNYGQYKYSGFSITPAIRFYTSKQAASLNGFYLGLFGRYYRYGMKIETPYDVTEIATFNTAYSSMGGGFYMGTQKRWKHFVMDWNILGIGWGVGSIMAKLSDSVFTQNDYTDIATSLKEDIPSATVTSGVDFVKFKHKLNLPMFKTGVTMGYAF